MKDVINDSSPNSSIPSEEEGDESDCIEDVGEYDANTDVDRLISPRGSEKFHSSQANLVGSDYIEDKAIQQFWTARVLKTGYE